ncbi:MAG: hypothetical protein H6Q68_285 [Firmicutes bacterium]|nr:hypothetical protein [Bacillota bacterium]
MNNRHSICLKCKSGNLTVKMKKERTILSSLFVWLSGSGILLFILGLILIILVPDDQPITSLSNDDLGYIITVVGMIIVFPYVFYRNRTVSVKKYNCIECGYKWKYEIKKEL